MISIRSCCLITRFLGRPSSSAPLFENSQFENKFTQQEREKILSTLNTAKVEELSKFKVTQTKLKYLINWKNKNGPFTTLSDLLDVDGVGLSKLEQLCQNILSNNIEETGNATVNKNKRSILTPNLNKDDINQLTSAVGLHIESSGISWAKLQRSNNELVNWNYYDFSTLPKKVLPTDTFNLAIKILHSLPLADIYILENKQNNSPAKNTGKAIPTHTHYLELTSMLLALINTRTSNDHQIVLKKHYPNKVYYLKSRLPARLFGAIVGSERVSTEATILNIINNNMETSQTLPCSKVSVNSVLTDDYCKCSKGYKDLLEQALLLVITFMDLCVYNNPISHSMISKLRK